MYNVMMLIMILMLMMNIWMLMSKKESGQQKNSPFECGFNLFTISNSFSNQYFMIALLFLIFDLEIILSIPIPMSENMKQSSFMGMSFFMFFVIILLMEWKLGAIDWLK